ncbi:serine/threonine-protein kinase [Neorhodopirellula lusitana]|uniref:serine/threonine-protein kinase n=1 Tax=Neorhodopirellula lusitana TaxID=445327 RepID=UPI00384F20A2
MTTNTPTNSQEYGFLKPSPHPGDLGTLGNYRILGELGKGGMGYVFRAEDTVLERAVALKVMNQKIASTSNSRERFIQEARAMAAVHHDNVVVIFEVGTHDNTPFMAMEMLRGETLEAVNKRKEGRDFRTVIDYASQISRGLAAAHAKGIVHRDIKPANIWIEEGSGRVKILDFGLALAQSPLDEFTGVGSVCGTPGYLTPEQARSDPLDARSDLYSLGVVLYEMCTGRLPIQCSAIAEQLVGLLAHTPKPLRDLNPDIPQPLADLIHQLLEKEPGERPASASALEEQLKKVAVECEAKTEVAMSLNKLQASLKEVVNKQTTDVEPAVKVVEQLPAFDTLDPLSIPSSPTNLPGPPIKPVAAPATFQRVHPASSPRPAKKPTTAAPPTSPLVWVAAGIAATLAAVGIGAWLIWPDSSSAPIVVSVPNTNNAQDTPSTSDQQPQQNTPRASGKQRNKSRNSQQNNAATNNNNRVVDDPQVIASPEDTASQQDMVFSEDTVFPQDNVFPQGNEPTQEEPTQPEPSPSIITETPSIDQPESILDAPSMTTEPSPPESTVPTKNLVLNTTEGTGADSTVRRNSPSNSYGLKPALAVHTKNGEETQHVYLRFDLKSLPVDCKEALQVALSLTLLKTPLPPSTELRLYGSDADAAERWREEGSAAITWNNSFSGPGLEKSLPLLVDLTSEDLIVKSKQIFFTSDKLTDFVRNSKGRSVTLVVAGSNSDNLAVLFVSRDKDAERAPALILKVPDN